jgi:hypothetical protein
MNFCLTEGGYLGWVPRKARVGDTICIFAGAKAPYFLRRVLRLGGPRLFTFIGEAYIHGLMYGEAMESIEYKMEEIKIL